MTRLLLTAFEPFGGEDANPSQEVARAIAAGPQPAIDVSTLVLPVYGRVTFERLLPAIDDGGFDAWLGLGQAGGRAQLAVERTGINLLVDRDVDGRALEEQTLVEGGPAAYFARLPVRELAAHIAAAGAPATVSNSAGAYVCNEALYVVQHHLATTGRDLPSGFVHLPYLPQQVANKPPGTPSMPLAEQLLGVRAALTFIAALIEARAAAAVG